MQDPDEIPADPTEYWRLVRRFRTARSDHFWSLKMAMARIHKTVGTPKI